MKVHTENDLVTEAGEWPETGQQQLDRESLWATGADAIICLRHRRSEILNRCPGKDSKMHPWPAG